MSDTTTNPIVSLEEQLRLAEEAATKLAEQVAENNRRLEELKKQQEDILNDPKERAKLFKNANDMIEAGIKEYESKGYVVNIVFDENNLFEKIVFKFGTSRKSGTRGPRKKAGQEGFIPAMTREHFEKIYSRLENNFTPADIKDLLKEVIGGSDYRLQPTLADIADKGYNGINIKSNGMRGRAAGYSKIS
jgi:hypothetical protein